MSSRRPSSRRTSAEHQEAVSRRLALLSAELSGLGRESPDDDPGLDMDTVDEVERDDYVMPLTHTRVHVARPAPTPREPDPPPDDREEPAETEESAPLPAPGRHSARRPRLSASLVPAALRGRVGLGPGPLTVVVAVLVVGVALTLWSLHRSQPRVVSAAPAGGHEVAALATPAAGLTSPAASAGAEEEVTVDVTGKVRRPGIVVLPAGSRVVDAVEAAGGARPGVDLATLNLARVLVDGEQIVVGQAVATAPVVPGVASPSGPVTLVNLNTAGQTELETLPDVGPVTAQAILAWRTEHGGFRSIEELLEVDGIGDATLATLTPHVTIG